MSVYYKRPIPIDCVVQGDIYADVEKLHYENLSIGEEGNVEVEGFAIIYEYCVVLTQACDLEQDYNLAQRKAQNSDSVDDDKSIPTILMAPAYLAEKLRKGTHLEDFDLKMQRINSSNWGIVIKNNNPRYHYMSSDLENNIPDLVVDFKHYFTTDRSLLYKKIQSKYCASLVYIYREELSQRFCNYLSRIGIPNNPNEIRDNFDSMLKRFPEI